MLRMWQLMLLVLLGVFPLLSFSPPCCAPRFGFKLVISEVLYDPVVEGNRPQYEWFEVSNCGSFPVDLYGFVFEDNAHRMVVACHVVLEPGEQLVVANNVTAFRELYPWFRGKIIEEVCSASTETDDPRDCGNAVPVDYSPFPHEDIYLNNGGDWIKVYYQDPGEGDPEGSSYLVDAVAWEKPPSRVYFTPPSSSEVGEWNREDVEDGYSIQRDPTCMDTDNCDLDFKVYPQGNISNKVTPGYENTATPLFPRLRLLSLNMTPIAEASPGEEFLVALEVWNPNPRATQVEAMISAVADSTPLTFMPLAASIEGNTGVQLVFRLKAPEEACTILISAILLSDRRIQGVDSASIEVGS